MLPEPKLSGTGAPPEVGRTTSNPGATSSSRRDGSSVPRSDNASSPVESSFVGAPGRCPYVGSVVTKAARSALLSLQLRRLHQAPVHLPGALGGRLVRVGERVARQAARDAL